MPPAILLLEYKSKAEMAHIPQSQDDHQMTMEDSEHNFQNIAEDIQMVRFTKSLCSFLSVTSLIKIKKNCSCVRGKEEMIILLTLYAFFFLLWSFWPTVVCWAF